MTAGLVIDVNDEQVRRALGRLRRRMKDLTAIFDEIGGRLEASTMHRFETQTAPDGAPWKPSKRAKRDSGETLTDTGRLRASITRRVRPDRVEVGSGVVYAAIHQFGGRTPPRTIRPRRKKALFWPGARHPVRSVRHPGSQVPARPFLGLSPGDSRAIPRIVARRLARDRQ